MQSPQLPAPGDFTFLNNKNTEKMMSDAYKATTLAEAWEHMKEEPGDGGYMYSNTLHESVKNISKFIKYDGHSGGSYAWTLRQIQYIAVNGWENYIKYNHISYEEFLKKVFSTA
jgi:hypothetical protein